MSKDINELIDELELKGTFLDSDCLMSVVREKAESPDYQPGPVRIYTDDEIKEYMRDKHQALSERD